jgi:hypothetical protein
MLAGVFAFNLTCPLHHRTVSRSHMLKAKKNFKVPSSLPVGFDQLMRASQANRPQRARASTMSDVNVVEACSSFAGRPLPRRRDEHLAGG